MKFKELLEYIDTSSPFRVYMLWGGAYDAIDLLDINNYMENKVFMIEVDDVLTIVLAEEE